MPKISSHGYDLKQLIRTSVYVAGVSAQLIRMLKTPAIPKNYSRWLSPPTSGEFSRRRLRREPASPKISPGQAAGVRAVQSWNNRHGSDFLTLYPAPRGDPPEAATAKSTSSQPSHHELDQLMSKITTHGRAAKLAEYVSNEKKLIKELLFSRLWPISD